MLLKDVTVVVVSCLIVNDGSGLLEFVHCCYVPIVCKAVCVCVCVCVCFLVTVLSLGISGPTMLGDEWQNGDSVRTRVLTCVLTCVYTIIIIEWIFTSE